MSQVTFSIPDEILLALNATPDSLASRIRLAASVKLYEMGRFRPEPPPRLPACRSHISSASWRIMAWTHSISVKRIRSTISRACEAICDTSPIQYLHQIGFLHWLAEFYTRTLIPPAVMGELVHALRWVEITLGILLRAKVEGRIPRIGPLSSNRLAKAQFETGSRRPI